MCFPIRKFQEGVYYLVNFSARLLGSRRLDVQLEQAIKTFPEQISVAPLRVTGAANETAQIGAASAPGIRLHTAALAGPCAVACSCRICRIWLRAGRVSLSLRG